MSEPGEGGDCGFAQRTSHAPSKLTHPVDEGLLAPSATSNSGPMGEQTAPSSVVWPETRGPSGYPADKHQ